MTTALPDPAPLPGRSPFAGADICQQAGLTLPAGARRPMFDDDLWDFTDVSGLPVSMPLSDRRFSFTPITSPQWRMVAKELIFAMLAPRHEAVALLPRANRTPVHLYTASSRLEETSRFLNWLASQGVASLGEVGNHHCEDTSSTVATCSMSTGQWSASAVRAPAAAPPRSSSTCSTTASCSPLTGRTPACGPGAGPPPPRSRRCPADGP